jgi:hypothetical protein
VQGERACFVNCGMGYRHKEGVFVLFDVRVFANSEAAVL